MALNAVVYPQPQGHFGYGHREYSSYALLWRDTIGFGDGEPYANEWDPLLLASLVQNAEEWEEEVGFKASPEREAGSAVAPSQVMRTATARRKRRSANIKNEEEIESQRMTHIAVERNRRRQMNEYLTVLRSFMPPSYSQRGDQASIVGGAINYVRELEQLLQSLEVQKSLKDQNTNTDDGRRFPFAGFFSLPQYFSTSASHGTGGDNANSIKAEPATSAVAADIETSMVEGHASLKVQVLRRPRQLLRLAASLQQLGLTTLHLNVEDECKLSSVEDIAAVVHDILRTIQEEQALVDTKTFS
ncbi:transcription factor bHLH96-like isoform X2 [Phragmites australis]|uniref:transcription factor bHLH96-like isoform X2 n=1 Tax=Phragmites australis TaxID=29695 RepID=UPI002D79BD30|nr:transcription factor bHLH96-like isoform X2 [Phragmites australis]